MTTTHAQENSIKAGQLFDIEKDFGCNVFDDGQMKNRLPSGIYSRLHECIQKRQMISMELANQVAHAMKEWALERGVTHYTHWFQPLTGLTAEKHDSFIQIKGSELMTSFKGDALVHGEPDASSFPSGGLRRTHAARGYTAWDPQTPAFIFEEGGVPTLYIPCCFFSWEGHALDKKIPLLRSTFAVEDAVKRLFTVLNEEGHDQIWCNSGLEQEFFMISTDRFNERIDLRNVGRTLQGRAAAKNQELSDHYFGPIPGRAWQALAEMERVAWRLGIPLTTRHQEVAPNQFEFAPIFQRSSVASDHNMPPLTPQLLMLIMQRVAARYGLTVLLHEKPFAGINGSGKHNNWSIGSPKVPTFMEPGPDPYNNRTFLLTCAAVLRSVDLHQDLIRWAIAGAANDHRLGGHEAPPSIISVYLGDYVGAVIDNFAADKGAPPKAGGEIDLGVLYIPKFDKDPSDRNRTSPFAFTGNKFEVRCVGASQRPAISNIMLNAMTADSFNFLADEIAALLKTGMDTEKAWKKVARDTINKHRRIIMNGDGYSQEWVEEAKNRGLHNFRTTPEVLAFVYNEKNVKLFTTTKVWSEEEFKANVVVDHANYCQAIRLEAETLRLMTDQYIIPATINYLNKLLLLGDSAPARIVNLVKKLLKEADAISSELQEKSKLLNEMSNDAVDTFDNLDDDIASSNFARNEILPKLKSLRKMLDELEGVVEKSLWPFPSYQDMLHDKHAVTDRAL